MEHTFTRDQITQVCAVLGLDPDEVLDLAIESQEVRVSFAYRDENGRRRLSEFTPGEPQGLLRYVVTYKVV